MKPLNWATLGCGVIANGNVGGGIQTAQTNLPLHLPGKTVICIPLPTAHMKKQ